MHIHYHVCIDVYMYTSYISKLIFGHMDCRAAAVGWWGWGGLHRSRLQVGELHHRGAGQSHHGGTLQQ